MPYALGLDFGTLSCRALLLDLDDPGNILQAGQDFEHGVMSEQLRDGTKLEGGDWALQDADDYLAAARTALDACVPRDDPRRNDIVGIGVDFTASSPLPTTSDGTPLSRNIPGKPHAYVKLWKHHRAEPQAERIRTAPGAEAFLENYAGQLSCEWLLPKALELIESAPAIWARTERFVEAGDWIVQQLTGQWTRNLCAAGFKGMWSAERAWPDGSWLKSLSPQLEGLPERELAGELVAPGNMAGRLTKAAAADLGLPAGIPVSAATIDAHSGLLGMGVDAPGSFGMIMGTSSCQLWLGEDRRIIPGVMGVVRDGILPGSYAYEAGQAAVGDLFSFFLRRLCPDGGEGADEVALHERLTAQAKSVPPGSNGHVVLDWVNGNRSVLLDPNLSAAMFGLTLDTRPEELYRACLEAAAFGCRVILETVRDCGIGFSDVVACGGLTKNELLMQIHADVLGLPVKVSAVEETVALGAALYGAMAAGRSLEGLTAPAARTYEPDKGRATAYGEVFAHYLSLHDRFGKEDQVLRHLRGMRAR